jgi:hypothetical protein
MRQDEKAVDGRVASPLRLFGAPSDNSRPSEANCFVASSIKDPITLGMFQTR